MAAAWETDPTAESSTTLDRVFDHAGCGQWDSGPHVHNGLYVADGSLMPTPLGVNPYFTIAALAERIADGISTDPAYANIFAPAA